MFGWVGTGYPRPLLAAYCLLAVVLMTVVLISKFATIAETQVDAPPVSNADQFAEAGTGYTMGTLGILGLTSAQQYTTADSENGYTLSSAKIEVPHYGWPGRCERAHTQIEFGRLARHSPEHAAQPFSDFRRRLLCVHRAGGVRSSTNERNTMFVTEAPTGHFELGECQFERRGA